MTRTRWYWAESPGTPVCSHRSPMWSGSGSHSCGGAKELLRPETFALMTAAHTDTLALRRGLAWQGQDLVGSPVGPSLGPDSFGHTGFTGTSVWVDPATGRYAVLLTNRVHPSRDGEGIVAVRHAFHTAAATLT